MSILIQGIISRMYQQRIKFIEIVIYKKCLLPIYINKFLFLFTICSFMLFFIFVSDYFVLETIFFTCGVYLCVTIGFTKLFKSDEQPV